MVEYLNERGTRVHLYYTGQDDREIPLQAEYVASFVGGTEYYLFTIEYNGDKEECEITTTEAQEVPSAAARMSSFFAVEMFLKDETEIEATYQALKSAWEATTSYHGALTMESCTTTTTYYAYKNRQTVQKEGEKRCLQDGLLSSY
jgi:hypothetical protein